MNALRKMMEARRLRLSGRVFLLIFVLVLLAAWNTGTNLFYLIVGGLFSFIFMSAVAADVTVRRLRVTREAPEAVHRAEEFGVTVRIENHKRVIPALFLRVESDSRPGKSAGYVLKIPARRAAVFRMTEMFPKRGVYPLPPITVVSMFPFGLMEMRRRIPETPAEVVVYPRVNAVRADFLERLPGAPVLPRVAVGDGDEFFSLREYVRGDDPRKISWRATARFGKLVVREYARGASRYAVFILDTYQPPDMPDFPEQFEEAIELVASLAVTLLHKQYTVAIATPGAFLAEGKGTSQVTKVLDLLARLKPTAEPGYVTMEPFALARANEARLVFVTADPRYWGDGAPFGKTWFVDPREMSLA
ncbi:MAG: hypothetical protein QG656_2297 [Candidatus Hydrogenedentes bacterium]|nr:hypothetical protein [Candidatus Hydrogenedentota bacterium]